MSKIEITRETDHLKIAVLDSTNVLVGYAYVGSDNDGGYQINRIESWAGTDSKVSIKNNVLSKLTVNKFNKLMSI
jgi:hypothetical protein